MKRFSVLTAMAMAGLLCGVTLGAPAPAQAEQECVEIELRTSPINARSGERLDCRVMNITDEELEIHVEHKDADDNDVQSDTFWLDDDEFAQSTVMVPFPSAQLVCEVEVEACYNVSSIDLIDIIKLIVEFPPVRGNLVRRDNERDFATSELRVTEINLIEE